MVSPLGVRVGNQELHRQFKRGLIFTQSGIAYADGCWIDAFQYSARKSAAAIGLCLLRTSTVSETISSCPVAIATSNVAYAAAKDSGNPAATIFFTSVSTGNAT